MVRCCWIGWLDQSLPMVRAADREGSVPTVPLIVRLCFLLVGYDWQGWEFMSRE